MERENSDYVILILVACLTLRGHEAGLFTCIMINYYLQSVWAPVVIELVPLRGGNEFGARP